MSVLVTEKDCLFLRVVENKYVCFSERLRVSILVKGKDCLFQQESDIVCFSETIFLI